MCLSGCSHGSLEMELAKQSELWEKHHGSSTQPVRPIASCRRHLVKHGEKNHKADALKFALGSLPKFPTTKSEKKNPESVNEMVNIRISVNRL